VPLASGRVAAGARRIGELIMEDKAIRGIRWTLLGHGASRVVALATTFVLARLLVPRDFGIVAFNSLVIASLLLVGTLGLGGAIVVRQDLGRTQLRTALTLMTSAYLACATVLVALSPLASDLLDEPRASGVLRALTIPVVFGGVTWFYAALMQRELQFARQFVCIGGQVVGIAVTSIPLAASGLGVWSLVIGQISGAVVYTALLVSLAPYRVTPGLDGETARSLWKSGWGFMLQGGASFVEQNADYAVIGIKVGSQQLGLYSIAYRIAEIPNNFIVEPVAQATFPGFARMRERGEDVAGAFLMTLRLTALCAFPLGVLTAAVAAPLIESILGPKWIGMVGLLQILGLWGSVRVVHATIGWFVNSMGFASHIGTSYAAMLVVSVPLLIVAADAGGAEAVAWVMVGNVIAMTAIVGTITHRRIGISGWRQWVAVRSSILASVPAWLAASRAAAALDSAPAGAVLLVSIGTGLGAYVGGLWVLDRRLLADTRIRLRRMRARGSAAG
jgi:PST family polysaccharide transporter